MADLSESSKIWPQINHLFNEQIIRVDSSSVPCQTLSWGLRHVMVKLQDRVFMLCPRYRWTSWGMGRPKTLKWDSGSSAPEPSRLSVPEHSLNEHLLCTASLTRKWEQKDKPNPGLIFLEVVTKTFPNSAPYIVVQLCRLFVTWWIRACQASLSFTISWSLLKPTSIESVMPSNHLALCRPLILLIYLEVNPLRVSQVAQW